MQTYSVKELAEKGAPIAMAMILAKREAGGEMFVTYGAICVELERHLQIPKIFPTHIGHVAGTMMDKIHAKYNNAPLINVLVTRPDGLPGRGIGGYLAGKYRRLRGVDWKDVPRKDKLFIVESERLQIQSYPHWDKVFNNVFGQLNFNISSPKYTEQDVFGVDGRGGGESDEHRSLKEWVAKNPGFVGVDGCDFKKTEYKLESGDTVDVVFREGSKFVVVEVKSRLSSDDDLKRGIYQCVKYREVMKAQNLPLNLKVFAVLVTEHSLPNDLAVRAHMLGVKTVVKAIKNEKYEGKSV